MAITDEISSAVWAAHPSYAARFGWAPLDMQDLGEFGKMNTVYGEFFTHEPPARSTIQVAALPKWAAVEIEAVAVIGEDLGD